MTAWTTIGCATARPIAEPVAEPAPEPVADPVVVAAPEPVVEAAPELPPPPPPPAACQLTRPVLEAAPTAVIDDPKGVMATFYRAMSRTLLGDDAAITRIGHWSDSTLASDGVSSYARRRLQLSYGDAGHGFVLPIRQIPNYTHRDVQRWSGGRWLNVPLVGGKTRDGRYGLGGWVSVGWRGAWATLATATERSPVGKAASKLHVYFHGGPRRGDLSVRLDGEPYAKIETSEAEPGDAMATVSFPDGHHRLSLRVSSAHRVRLFGAALEREGPGFVYDSFGILGALSRRFSRIEPDHWRRQLAFRDHDLVMIQFGGNSIQDGGLNYTRYREQFRALVQLFRKGNPDASCLVLSPHDHGRRRRKHVIDTDPKLLRLLPLQREVALEEGCAWLSVFEAMGGEGSMGRYHRERKAYGDLRHLRNRGAKSIANHLVDALEQGFIEHLDGLGCSNPEHKPDEPIAVDRFAG